MSLSSERKQSWNNNYFVHFVEEINIGNILRTLLLNCASWHSLIKKTLPFMLSWLFCFHSNKVCTTNTRSLSVGCAHFLYCHVCGCKLKKYFGKMCLCLGPTGSGKTLLLKKLQNKESIDLTSNTVPTVGTNLVTITFENQKETTIREIGGAMAPIWKNYYNGINKIIYVVDASNLCQIAAAGVLLYSILAEPCLQKAKVLLALSKMDVSYRQMRNEALLMLQLSRLKQEISQEITVIETSAMTGVGVDDIMKWLQGQYPPKPKPKPKT